MREGLYPQLKVTHQPKVKDMTNTHPSRCQLIMNMQDFERNLAQYWWVESSESHSAEKEW